jgi:Right handed beta helix region
MKKNHSARFACPCCIWIFVLLSLLAPADSHAATYYVSTTGSDSNPGTLGQPWRTIGKAASNQSLKPGDAVYVRGGTYSETVSVTVSGSGTGGLITFAAYPGEAPIIDAAGITPPSGADTGLFLIANHSWLVIQGFELRNYQTSIVKAIPAGIFLRGACQNITIRKCNIHDIYNTGGTTSNSGNAFGIAVYGSSTTPASGIVIDGNDVHNLKTGASESLTINGNVTNFLVTNNTVHDNNNIGIDCIGFENTCPDPAQDQACSGNTVWNISSQGNQAYTDGDYSADGLYCDGAANVTMERNIVYGTDIGVELASEHSGKLTSNILLRDNFVFNNRQTGLFLGGYANAGTGGTQGCAITNNSFFQNDTLAWSNGEIQMRWRTSNCVFRDNILYASSQNLLVSVPVSGTNNVNNTFDYNLYYCDSGSASSGWSWNKQACTGLAAWKATSGQDGHAAFLNPLFVNTAPASINLHLQLDSPAVDAGDPAFVAASGELDVDSGLRVTGSRVDIGADELAPFDSWRLFYFTGNAKNNAVAGPLANPAHDGITNLMKYALGLNPAVSYGGTSPGMSLTGTTSGGASSLALTFSGTAKDITYSVQATSDLAAWTTLYQSTVGQPPGEIIISDTIPVSSAQRRFMRLQAAGP